MNENKKLHRPNGREGSSRGKCVKLLPAMSVIARCLAKDGVSGGAYFYCTFVAANRGALGLKP